MAVTRFSTGFNITRPTSPVNLELLDNVLSTKQKQYDEGYINIQKQLQSYDSLDLIRPEDIEYKNRKVAELTEQLDNYGNIDLSDPKESFRLQNEAASLAKDSELISKVSNTQKYRQLVSRYAKMKENPKLLPYYSDINERRDMKIANQWLNGTSSSMPISSPTLYTDTDKEIGKILKQMEPTTYSVLNGLYRINGELKSESDLKNVAINSALSNPQLRSQLMINAEEIFDGMTPDQIYSNGLTTINNQIEDLNKSLINSKNELNNTNLSKEDRITLKRNIEANESALRELGQKQVNLVDGYNRGDTSQLAQLKMETYLDSWGNSVVKPYVVKKEKVVGDQPAMLEYKEQSRYNAEQRRMQFDAQQKQLDREASLQEKIIGASGVGNKTGMKPTIDSNGQIRWVEDTKNLVTLGALQNNNITALKGLEDTSTALKNSNRGIIVSMTKEILSEADPNLLAQIKPVLEKGNLIDDNGRILANTQGLSEGQINMIRQYDEMLDKSADPNFIKSNPILNKYGNYSNALIENQLKWTQIDTEKENAIVETFNEARKEGFTGNLAQFKNALKGEAVNTQERLNNPSLFSTPQLGYNPNNYKPTNLNDYTSKVNAKIAANPKVNRFNVAKTIDDKDDSYDGAIDLLARETGVIINGVETSINGQVVGGKSFRNNEDGVKGFKTRAIIPASNQVMVDVLYNDKDKATERAIIQLNPSQMLDLTGNNSETTTRTNFASTLTNGRMVDQSGNPLYFNLNGDIPDMVGNLQYRLWNLDDDKLTISMKVPTSKGFDDLVVRGVSFQGDNALQKVKTYLISKYVQASNTIDALYPKATKEEKGKLVLESIYNEFE